MAGRGLKGRRVMVTGGAGFIGSALVRELLASGAHVVVYDNFLYGDTTNLAGVEGKVSIVTGDVLSSMVYQTIKEFRVDSIFHLAAEPYIPHSYENPEKFFDVNVKGTMNVLMASKVLGVGRVVCFSTSEVYGNAQYTPMDEDHPTLPLSTYAVSKLAADRMCHVFAYEHRIPVIIVRPFNAYGPRETQPYVIPEIISQVAKSNKIRLGNINARRDFTYVHDIAKGAIAVMTSDIPYGDVVNLGSSRSHSIKEIALRIARIMGSGKLKIVVDKKRLRPKDVELLRCDYTKAARSTGWRPTTGLTEGLSATVKYFMDNGQSWIWEQFPQ